MENEHSFIASTSFASFPVSADDVETARERAVAAIRALGFDQESAETVRIEPVTYTFREAIMYLYDHAAEANEWQEAAMWHAVCKVVAARRRPGLSNPVYTHVYTHAWLRGLIENAEAE